MPAYTTRAATILQSRFRSKIDPALVVEIIAALVKVLSQCQPKPEDGYAYLAWRPVSRWWDFLPWVRTLEERLYAYRQKINEIIAQLWKWLNLDRGEFIRALWVSVDAGELTPELVAGLYGEARK